MTGAEREIARLEFEIKRLRAVLYEIDCFACRQLAEPVDTAALMTISDMAHKAIEA